MIFEFHDVHHICKHSSVKFYFKMRNHTDKVNHTHHLNGFRDVCCMCHTVSFFFFIFNVGLFISLSITRCVIVFL